MLCLPLFIYLHTVYCGYSDTSVNCFTNLTTQIPLFYLDGIIIHSKQFIPPTVIDLNQIRGYRLLKFTISTANWTVGSHLFEAGLNSMRFRFCGVGYQPPSYVAVITKEGKNLQIYLIL